VKEKKNPWKGGGEGAGVPRRQPTKKPSYKKFGKRKKGGGTQTRSKKKVGNGVWVCVGGGDQRGKKGFLVEKPRQAQGDPKNGPQ